MAIDRVWTAAELEHMSEDERQRVFDQGIIWDFDELPPELVERIRQRGMELAIEHGLIEPEPR